MMAAYDALSRALFGLRGCCNDLLVERFNVTTVESIENDQKLICYLTSNTLSYICIFGDWTATVNQKNIMFPVSGYTFP